MFCTPGFNALRFFAWLDEAKPTWYTAVPTMHQAILPRAAATAEVIARDRLRFIRSSSASLPPQVMAAARGDVRLPGDRGLRHDRGGAPDGLQPAAAARRASPARWASRPGPRSPSWTTTARCCRPDATGEIVIRGPNVTAGYENNPKANADAFTNGWFRTGDQGVIDDEGYLRLTGRLKEIINRGGEKISPREVDEVLMDHPAVAQVVTFAMPHDKLGEEVAAAVVLREGLARPSASCAISAPTALPTSRCRARCVILDEIPKGATGKLQRIGLAAEAGAGHDEDRIFGAGRSAGICGELARPGVDVSRSPRAASGGDARTRTDRLIGGEDTLPSP